ncbi:hypothetical protein GMDG_03209 [Pseudogymnoascus destructans 20631-21]|uniref:Uncharacterized protein n=1 Tax=Pseudogymnoascus destructans (strain ATCC MYA-4855 / 20631-21) TaxID=658429 RepID=L8G5H4_PSED2|nr:hypothetical protein GMDG_03209 [Pseudogymnoascus destructans 20631-21]
MTPRTSVCRWLLRMLTHMSLMCDPRAPVHVPDEYLAALPPDPVITALEQDARTKRRNIISQEFQDEYFCRRPTEDIERHNNGQHDEEYIEPVVEHQIPQRTQ